MAQVRRRPNRYFHTSPWTWLGLMGLGALLVIVGFFVLRSNRQPIQSGPQFPTHFRPRLVTSGKPALIARGHRLTVVMLMASWCLYCAYEDKYVWPHIVRSFPGVQIDIIDISSKGGIGVPGPRHPAFTGHDNVGPTITIAGMRKTMVTYRQQFGLKNRAVDVYVDPTAGGYWHVTSFPTLLFVNPAGRVVNRTNGALPYPQMAALISSLER